jgi:hypothetical protein
MEDRVDSVVLLVAFGADPSLEYSPKRHSRRDIGLRSRKACVTRHLLDSAEVLFPEVAMASYT